MIRLARCRDAAAALTLCGTLLACGDGSTDPVAASLSLDRATTRAGQVLPVMLHGPSLPSGALSVTLGGEPVTPVRVDDSTFAVVVPALPTGQHDVVLTLGDEPVSVRIGVTAAAEIADPVDYIDNALAQAQAELEALSAQYADPALRPRGVDAAAFERDLATMSGKLAEAQAALVNATPTERAQAAAFLAANADALGISATGGMSLMMAASGDGACLSETGEQLDNYEQCSAALTAFGEKAQLKLVALAALTAVAYAEGMSFVGLIAAAATAYVIYKELEKIQDGTFKRFIDPVIGKLVSIETFDGSTASAQFSLMAAGSEFTTGVPETYDVFAEYRSVSLADRNVTGLAGLVRLGQRLDSFIGRIRSMMFLDPIRKVVPATAATVVVEQVPPQYLSLGPISQGVGGSARDSTGDWLLTFSKAPLMAKLPFRFDIRYTAPASGVQTLSRSVTLAPLPMKYSGTIVVPVTQRRALQLGTCTWTGQITGTLTVEYTSATAVTAVFTGETVYNTGVGNPADVTFCEGGIQPLAGTLTGKASNGTFTVTDGWFKITGALAGTTSEFVRGTAGEQYDFINDFGERVWGGGSGSYEITRVDEATFVAGLHVTGAGATVPDEPAMGSRVRPAFGRFQ